VESWDIDNMGKTKDVADMLETYLLATCKDKKEKNSKEMAKRQLAAGELLLTMSVSRGSTSLRVILEEVRNNIKANTDELIEALGCVLGLETPRILGRQLWRMLLEICCREKKIMTNPKRKHLVKTVWDWRPLNLVSGHRRGDPNDPSDDDEDEDGDDDRGGSGRLPHGKEDAG
jgi:hypothetical protein